MSRPPLLLAFGLTACSLDVNVPQLVRPPDALDVNVDFCAGDLPNWFAVRNEGQPWVVTARATRQRHSIPVSPRVTIAYGRTLQVGGQLTSTIKVLYVTAEELADATCGPLIGSKTLYANVSGFTNGDVVVAAMAGALGTTDPTADASETRQLTIPGVVTGPTDLLVYAAPVGDRPKYILRHAIDQPSGTLLDALNFGSNEAMYSVRPPLAISGGTSVQAWSTFLSGNGTSWELGALAAPNGIGNYVSLPQHRIGPNDMHRTTVIAPDGRNATVYVSIPNALTLSLGPALSAPTITTIASDPALRLRATIPSQAAYPNFASATFYQGASLQKSITVAMSAAYLGGQPTEWQLDVPELEFLGANLLLTPGVATQWRAESWSASSGLFFGHTGRTDGSLVTCATATSLPSPLSNACRSPMLLSPQQPPLETGALLLSP